MNTTMCAGGGFTITLFLYFFKSDCVSGDNQRGRVSSHGAGSSG